MRKEFRGGNLGLIESRFGARASLIESLIGDLRGTKQLPATGDNPKQLQCRHGTHGHNATVMPVTLYDEPDGVLQFFNGSQKEWRKSG
jgi:hypothetical protein